MVWSAATTRHRRHCPGLDGATSQASLVLPGGVQQPPGRPVGQRGQAQPTTIHEGMGPSDQPLLGSGKAFPIAFQPGVRHGWVIRIAR